MQDAVFLAGEGSAWWRRNRDVIRHRSVENDPVVLMLKRYSIKPKSVCEVGCADGWRLRALSKRYHCQSYGVDPSCEAINAEPIVENVFLRVGTAQDMRIYWQRLDFDVVIAGFCLYLIDRSTLFDSLAAIDVILAPGGWLVIHDFSPDYPDRVPYKHCEGLFSYKLRYDQVFTSTGLYSLVAHETFPHSDHRPGWAASQDRVGVSLLKKEMIG